MSRPYAELERTINVHQTTDAEAIPLLDAKSRSWMEWILEIRKSKNFLLVAMCLSTLSDNLIYGIVLPIFPISLRVRAHVPEEDLQFWIWLALSAFGISQLMCSPLAALAASRAKTYAPVITISLAALLCATLLYVFSDNPWLIIVARFAQGGSNAIVNVVGLAALVNRFGADNCGYAFGYIGMSTSVGCVAGPVVGGLVHDLVGYEAVFVISAIIIGVTLVVVLAVIEEPAIARARASAPSYGATQQRLPEYPARTSAESGIEDALTIRKRPESYTARLVLGILGTALCAIIPAAYDTVLPLYTQRLFGWGSLGSGLIFLTFIPGALCGPYFGQLADRTGTKALTIGACIYSACVCACMCAIRSPTSGQVVALCFLGFLLGFCEPILFTLSGSEITSVVEGDESSNMSTKDKVLWSCVLTNYGVAGGVLIGPILAGNMEALVGWTGTNLSLAGILALGGGSYAPGLTLHCGGASACRHASASGKVDVGLSCCLVPIKEQDYLDKDLEFEMVDNPKSMQLPVRDMKEQYYCDNEWTTLREVLVGRAEHSCFPHVPLKALANIIPRYYLDEFTKPNNPIPAEIVKKADEELDNFASVLTQHGVQVRRPQEVDWVKEGGYTGSMLRDGLMVVGNTIIEAAFSWGCRQNEIELLHGPMLREFEEKGMYKVVRAPKVPQPDNIFDVEPGSYWAINNSRIAFDTADFMRIGKYIVGHQSNATNQKGIEWVRAHLPQGHQLVVFESKNQKEMHLDVTFVPLMDGTALYYPDYVELKELRKHKPLDTWRLLPPPKKFPMPKYPPPYMASGCLAMNLLVLDGKRVFCYHDDLEMQSFLRRLGMDPIGIPFRHVGCLGGSFHCATLDLRRDPM